VCCPVIGELGGTHDYFVLGNFLLFIIKKWQALLNWLICAAQTGSRVKPEPVCS